MATEVSPVKIREPHEPAAGSMASEMAPPVKRGPNPKEGEVRTAMQGVWKKNGVDWPGVIFMAIIHAGALAAPFFFTWQGLALMAGLSWFFGSIGICLGFHRYLTHGSFQTYKPVRYVLALVGNLAGEGSVLTWVANHRKHHVYSDKDGDPHSPRDGGLWSHMLWFMPNFGKKWHQDLTNRWCPDLVADKFMVFLHRTFLLWYFASAGVLYALGYWLDGNYMGWSFVFWGLFVRMVYVYHVTWFVNSATHMWGYRNYETTDDSTNLWWVGLFAFGEGWHNNHHAFQRMAKHGHKWWEIDLTYCVIWTLEKVGLAWNVVKDPPAHGRPA